MIALIDNDILMKVACFGLVEQLLVSPPLCSEQVGVLGSAKFVLRKAIETKFSSAAAPAIQALESFVDSVEQIEPSEDEQTIASEIEAAAQVQAVFLDSGESQLCAVMISRALERLYTGDKRAIVAIAALVAIDSRLSLLLGKVECLEQLVVKSLSEESFDQICVSICSEPEVDKALAICFSCRRGSPTLEAVLQGLESYIRDLREGAPEVLVD